MKDLKEALGSARKADITHVRSGIKRYIARACSYGSAKYERANFLRPAGDTRADFERLRAYLRAASSHIDATLDAMELHLANDPQLVDVEGMRRAAYAEDTDAKPGCPVGASGLPHVAHAAASLMMAIEQATVYGLLPTDPGEPWAERVALVPCPEPGCDEPDVGTEVVDEREQMYVLATGDRPVTKSLHAMADEVAAEMEPSDAQIVAWWCDGACALCGNDRGDYSYTCDSCCIIAKFPRAMRVVNAYLQREQVAPKHTVVGLGDQIDDPPTQPWSVLSGGKP